MSRVGSLALALAWSLAPLAGAAAMTLDDLAWSRRVVLAFAAPDAPEVAVLRDALAREACRTADRDLDVYLVGPQSVEPLSAGAVPLPGESAERLRRALRSPGAGFQMVLIGKDGGVKARSSSARELVDFFTRIDAMPMRRAEMRARPDACSPRADVGNER